MELFVQQSEQQILEQLPDKYEILSSLQGGKNANVFLARHKLLDSKVFIKVYHTKKSGDDRLLSEPQLLRKASSRYIADIYDADFLPSGNLMLAMEMLDGGSFQDEITKCNDAGRGPSLHAILDAVRDAAFGLQELHDKGFVHRDVKPANLMFRIQPAGRLGVVTDLGLVARLNEKGRAVRSSQARAYRPPEAFKVGTYSASSDVYQLGLVLYQMLGGAFQYPAETLSDQDLENFILTEQMIELGSLSPVIGQRIRRLLKKCICPEGERYDGTPALLLELNNIRSSESNWEWNVSASKSVFTRRQSDFTRVITVDSVTGTPTLTIQEARGVKALRGRGRPITLRKKDWQTQRDFTNALYG
ncbi:MAG: serine/threonine-protein kinase [Fimbriimonadaceae bacterium]